MELWMDAPDFRAKPICIPELHASLNECMSSTQRDRLKITVLDGTKLVIEIDGQKRPTLVSVWADGACDVDWLEMPEAKGAFKTLNFRSNQQAMSALICEIEFALERA
jgi:hypothetical protein